MNEPSVYGELKRLTNDYKILYKKYSSVCEDLRNCKDKDSNGQDEMENLIEESEDFIKVRKEEYDRLIRNLNSCMSCDKNKNNTLGSMMADHTKRYRRGYSQ